MARVPAEVTAWLREVKGKTVFVVTHESPDGDAIGSLLAARHLLGEVGAHALALCADPVPEVYRFLVGSDAVAGPADLARGGVSAERRSPDAVLYLDCGERSRVGPLAGQLPAGVFCVNIDHHTSNNQFADINWVDAAASSTGEMLVDLFSETGVPFGAARDAIYAALVTDTGGFAFESTTTRTHEAAAALLCAGTRPGDMHDLIYNSRDPAALALLGTALCSLKLAAGGRIAYLSLDQQAFAAAGAGQEHTDGIVNYARSLRGVEVGLLFYSMEPGVVKVGIRTRPGVAAHEIARAFGGGGHPRAAGCRIAGSVDAAAAAVVAEARRRLPAQ